MYSLKIFDGYIIAQELAGMDSVLLMKSLRYRVLHYSESGGSRSDFALQISGDETPSWFF